MISIPGAVSSFASDVNNAGEISGTYVDDTQGSHGFLRSARGVLTLPIDYPGASYTSVSGLNDRELDGRKLFR